MSTLLDEINKAFSNLPEGKAKEISGIQGAMGGWLIREKNGLMIAALPTKYSKAFDEKFQSIHMRTSMREIAGKEIKLISIESDQYETRSTFARLCEDFLSESNAADIALDPKNWWHQWKALIGNSSINKKPYAVLGELYMLRKLIAAGEAPSWIGPEGGSHDIVLPHLSIEVKSTTDKVDQSVTISSHFQMTPAGDKRLFLAHLRFEKDKGELSINSTAESLVSTGFDAAELETKLRRLGYPTGRICREQLYGINEAELYPVNDKFPRIVPESFKGETFPSGVVKIIYDINLSNLNHITLDSFLEEFSPSPR